MKTATFQPLAGFRNGGSALSSNSGMLMTVPAAGTGLNRVRLRLAGSMPYRRGAGGAPGRGQYDQGIRRRHGQAVVDRSTRRRRRRRIREQVGNELAVVAFRLHDRIRPRQRGSQQGRPSCRAWRRSKNSRKPRRSSGQPPARQAAGAEDRWAKVSRQRRSALRRPASRQLHGRASRRVHAAVRSAIAAVRTVR